jgi:hypothetical protein
VENVDRFRISSFSLFLPANGKVENWGSNKSSKTNRAMTIVIALFVLYIDIQKVRGRFWPPTFVLA